MNTAPATRLLSAAALAMLIAQPGWTQEAPAEPAEAPAETSPAETPAEPAAEDAPTLDETAPAEGEAAAEGAAPEPEVLEVVRETHGEWEVRCLPDGSECFLYQLALDVEENPVAEFSLIVLPEGSEAVAGATVVTPLGTLLPAGLVLQVDSGEARQYEFAFCSQVGCFARFGLDGTTVTALKRGGAANLMLRSIGAPEEPIELAVSLTGFTAAYDSLEAAPAEPLQQ